MRILRSMNLLRLDRLPVVLFIFILIITGTVLKAQNYSWHQITNGIYNTANFEDIWFINSNTGWLIHNYGMIYRTTDGGYNWVKTDSIGIGGFTSVEFINETTGWISSRSLNLLKTTNGGSDLVRITNFPAPVPSGLECIRILGGLNIFSCGNYNASATFVKSTDGGATWTTRSLTSLATGLRDCYFFNENAGLVVGCIGTGSERKAVVLYTSDGGMNWTKVYQGNRVIESVQKLDFVDQLTGYASLERITYPEKFVLKTTNGGLNWTELDFPNYHEHGIGFINASTGWIGGDYNPTFGTTDGGKTWFNANIGQFIFGFHFFGDTLGYACGKYVYKYEKTSGILPASSGEYSEFALIQNYPNPFNPSTTISFTNAVGAEVSLVIYDLLGRVVSCPVKDKFITAGDHSLKFNGTHLPGGVYICSLNIDGKQKDVMSMVLVK